MKTKASLIVLALVFSGCSAQEKKSDTKHETDMKPKESWKVNKKLDDDGNIIAYDSTYTWTYSNMDGDNVSVNADSVMAEFRSYFNDQFPSDWNKGFGQSFWNDTIYRPGFFRDDYFHNLWRNDMYRFDEMFKRMDSMRMSFFDEMYPGLIGPPVETETDPEKE